MYQKFINLLGDYQLEIKGNKYLPVLRDMLRQVFIEQNKEQLQEVEIQEKRVKEISKKLERLEERFVFEEISKEQYDKFRTLLEN